MADLRQNIKDEIVKNRPKLGNSSVTTYVSCLFNLWKQMKEEKNDLDFFDKTEDILAHLKDRTSVSRKTTLSALFVLTGKTEYREKMISDCKTVNDNYQTQTKSKTESENWISTEDITKVYKDLLDKVETMFKTKVVHHATMVEFWLVALLGGVAGIAPRRSQDYALMKVRNYDIKTDNYYKSGKLYFNVYKTSKNFGQQSLELPKELNVLMKKWIKCNTNDYLLFSNNDGHLSSSQITRVLNKCFGGKHISTDMLRHIYLTNRFKDMPALSEMNKVATEMSHSTATALTYIKKD